MYEGKTFTVDIILTNEYPFEEPKAKFDTKIWHPSIDNDIGDLTEFIHSLAWTEELNLKALLLSLQVFLSDG